MQIAHLVITLSIHIPIHEFKDSFVRNSVQKALFILQLHTLTRCDTDSAFSYVVFLRSTLIILADPEETVYCLERTVM